MNLLNVDFSVICQKKSKTFQKENIFYGCINNILFLIVIMLSENCVVCRFRKWFSSGS